MGLESLLLHLLMVGLGVWYLVHFLVPVYSGRIRADFLGLWHTYLASCMVVPSSMRREVGAVCAERNGLEVVRLWGNNTYHTFYHPTNMCWTCMHHHQAFWWEATTNENWRVRSGANGHARSKPGYRCQYGRRPGWSHVGTTPPPSPPCGCSTAGQGREKRAGAGLKRSELHLKKPQKSKTKIKQISGE